MSQVNTDFILNGQAGGDVASVLLNSGFDTGVLRPYLDQDADGVPTGQTCITRNNAAGEPQAVPVNNANATLLRLEWTLLDEVVIRAALPRLKAVADVRGRGLQFTIPNGMSKTVLDTQAQSDIGPASMTMDGLNDSKGDRPLYNLTHLPLPIIHKDFSFPARQIATARAGGMPLDFSMAELAARRVAEGAEQLLIGTAGSYTFGGGSVYGYTNFPSRTTFSLSDPTSGGWSPSLTLADVLNMRQLATNALHYGPYVLYVSLAWDRYMDSDYILTGGNVATQTLRERLRQIENIEDVVTLDYLNGYDMVLVQMTSNVVREVVGMDITTVQWETHGGMMLNFKIMCILTPQLRADFNGRTGIVHGNVAGKNAVTAGVIPFSASAGSP